MMSLTKAIGALLVSLVIAAPTFALTANAVSPNSTNGVHGPVVPASLEDWP